MEQEFANMTPRAMAFALKRCAENRARMKREATRRELVAAKKK